MDVLDLLHLQICHLFFSDIIIYEYLFKISMNFIAKNKNKINNR